MIMDSPLKEASLSMASKANLPELLAHLQLIQPHLPRTLELLHWQYFENPDGPTKIYTIRGSQDQKLHSMLVVSPQKVRMQDHVRNGHTMHDLMTHPDWRGRGYFHYLGELAFREITERGDFTYTVPNELSQKGFQRAGWKRLFLVPSRMKVLGSSKSGDPNVTTVSEMSDPFTQACTEIWDQSGVGMGSCRSMEYLNWRYRKPGQVYRKFWVGDRQGFFILKIYSDGSQKTLHILDLLVTKNARELIPGVLRFCEHYAYENGAQTITAWLDREHFYSSYFDRAGLVMAERPTRWVNGNFEAFADQGAMDHANWHITQGDSDVY